MTASWPVISNYSQAFYLQMSKIYSKQFLQNKKKFEEEEDFFSFLGKHSNLDLLMQIFFTTLCKHPYVCHSPNLCNLINAKKKKIGQYLVLHTSSNWKYSIFKGCLKIVKQLNRNYIFNTKTINKLQI